VAVLIDQHEVFLRREVPVHRHRRHARGLCDVVHGRAVVPALDEQPHRMRLDHALRFGPSLLPQR
jgi:hypothetical protein